MLASISSQHLEANLRRVAVSQASQLQTTVL